MGLGCLQIKKKEPIPCFPPAQMLPETSDAIGTTAASKSRNSELPADLPLLKSPQLALDTKQRTSIKGLIGRKQVLWPTFVQKRSKLPPLKISIITLNRYFRIQSSFTAKSSHLELYEDEKASTPTGQTVLFKHILFSDETQLRKSGKRIVLVGCQPYLKCEPEQQLEQQHSRMIPEAIVEVKVRPKQTITVRLIKEPQLSQQSLEVMLYRSTHIRSGLMSGLILTSQQINQSVSLLDLYLDDQDFNGSIFVAPNTHPNKLPIPNAPLLTYFQLCAYVESNFQSFYSQDCFDKCKKKPHYQIYFLIQIVKALVEKYPNALQDWLKESEFILSKIIRLSLPLFCFAGLNQVDASIAISTFHETKRKQPTILSDALRIQFGIETSNRFRRIGFSSIKDLKVMHYVRLTTSQAAQICLGHKSIDKSNIEAIMETLPVSVKYQSGLEINQIYRGETQLRALALNVLQQLERRDLKCVETWKKLAVNIQKLNYISHELLLTCITLKTMMAPPESTKDQEQLFAKAVHLCHTLYSDPRCRAESKRSGAQLWEYIILEGYDRLLPERSCESAYVRNMQECLAVDAAEGELHLSGFVEGWLTSRAPIKHFTGRFYLQNHVWDLQVDQTQSSKSFTVLDPSFVSANSISSTSKKWKKNGQLFGVLEGSFSLKETSGLLKWGDGVGLPLVHPAVKNMKVLLVASGSFHSVFVTERGLYGEGQNKSGQLGDQPCFPNSKLRPIWLTNIDTKSQMFSVSCGNQHTAFLLDGKLYMWGQRQGGILAGHGYNFQSICCGGLHTLGLRDGKVYSWGRGEGGQLGHPLTQLKQLQCEETVEFYLDEPKRIQGLSDICEVACGDAHSLALSKHGEVFVFGFSYQGQLGLGLTGDSPEFQIFEPVRLKLQQVKFTRVFAGPTCSFFKTSQGSMYGCGLNDCLQIGVERVLKVFAKKTYLHRVGKEKKRGQVQFSQPRLIHLFSKSSPVHMHVVSLECGQNHSLALVRYENGSQAVVGWGLNKSLQLGGEYPQYLNPRTIECFFDRKVRQISCGGACSYALVGEEEASETVKSSSCMTSELTDSIQLSSQIRVV